MTPTAVTPVGRGTRSEPRQGTPPRTGGRKPPAKPAAKPSGKSPGSRSAGASRAAAVTQSAGGQGTGHRSPLKRSTVPRAPRRVSGPSRPAPMGPSARPSGRPRVGHQPLTRPPLARRSASYIRALPDHALLDRIVRGRAWIPLLGVLLVGIVAMQVEVLKLNASIGRSLEQGNSLQIRNQELRAAVARAADDQRIESMAAHMGMVMPAPAAIRFLAARPLADVAKAESNIHSPNATTYQAALTAAGVAAGTAGSNAVGTSGTTGTTGATSGTPGTTSAATGATGGTAATSTGG